MWMSPVRKCGWLDMENTKLVSGEIQHSSSKTRKCERLGLTNAKGPNQEIQISAGTNPISSKANQSKLCEGSRSVICHMLHVTCIYWIITLTEKMMGHNHFDDQFMSKLSITSTSWPNCWVEYKVEYKIVEWSIKWSIKWSIDFDIPLFISRALYFHTISTSFIAKIHWMCQKLVMVKWRGFYIFYICRDPGTASRRGFYILVSNLGH